MRHVKHESTFAKTSKHSASVSRVTASLDVVEPPSASCRLEVSYTNDRTLPALFAVQNVSCSPQTRTPSLIAMQWSLWQSVSTWHRSPSLQRVGHVGPPQSTSVSLVSALTLSSTHSESWIAPPPSVAKPEEMHSVTTHGVSTVMIPSPPPSDYFVPHVPFVHVP